MSNRLGKYRLLARQIALKSVRNNTILEELHAGKKLPMEYLSYSRITEEEMRTLMLQVEENLKICLWVYLKTYSKEKLALLLKSIKLTHFGEYGISWDIPNKKYEELSKK